MINSTQQAVDFLGHQINCVPDAYGTPHVPLKSLCDILGIDHDRQRRKIKGNGLFNRKIVCVKGMDGRHRNMLCLPLSRIRDWASTIDPTTLSPEVAEALTDLLEEPNESLTADGSQTEGDTEKERIKGVYDSLHNMACFLNEFRYLDRGNDEVQRPLPRRTC